MCKYSFLPNNDSDIEKILAPIFDNGSSFFPRINSDKACKEIISNQDEIKRRIFCFPTSQIRINNKKSSYYDVISSLKFSECNKALKKLYSLVKVEKIDSFINSISDWSATRKDFYRTIFKKRLEGLWKGLYEKLCLIKN